MIDGLISDEYVKAGVPLHRAGTIDDMGGLILFLTSRVRSLPPALPARLAGSDTTFCAGGLLS